MLSRAARILSMSAVAAVMAVCTIAGAAAATTRPDIVQRVTDAAPAGPKVVAIGDSIMEGHGLDPADAWPALLAARDGSGFVTVGNAGDTFADQARVAIALHPNVVIVSGSSNDLGVSDATLNAATTATVTELRAALPHATILAVSPVWGDTRVPAQLDDIATQVKNAVTGVGGTVLDIGQPLSGRSDLMQSDDVHPTAAGQKVLADAVDRALTSAKVTF